MDNKIECAKILIEALPYIQKYYGKCVVIKYGGNAMINKAFKNSVTRDIVLLAAVGVKVVLVHGGGPEISNMLAKLGKESTFVNGLRYTDEETVEIVSMVLAGKVNKDLVSLIHSNNGRAIGLCGADGGMILTGKLETEIDMGFVGQIKKVDVSPLLMSMSQGFIPVVATVGVDENGQVYNVNADTAAAAIAAAMKAEKLILMTDVAGVLRDQEDEGSLIPEIDIKDVPSLVSEGIISGGMLPKIDSCADAIRNGLKEAVIIDGRNEHSVLLELLSDSGYGTLFYSR
jgi:acetylglutamate kinase